LVSAHVPRCLICPHVLVSVQQVRRRTCLSVSAERIFPSSFLSARAGLVFPRSFFFLSASRQERSVATRFSSSAGFDFQLGFFGPVRECCRANQVPQKSSFSALALVRCLVRLSHFCGRRLVLEPAQERARPVSDSCSRQSTPARITSVSDFVFVCTAAAPVSVALAICFCVDCYRVKPVLFLSCRIKKSQGFLISVALKRLFSKHLRNVFDKMPVRT
jgi:hypothetical protein